jgi:hypothetical protein
MKIVIKINTVENPPVLTVLSWLVLASKTKSRDLLDELVELERLEEDEANELDNELELETEELGISDETVF